MSAALALAGAAAVLAVLAITLAVFGLADVPGRWRRARAIRRAQRFFRVLGVDPLPWQLEYFGSIVRGRRHPWKLALYRWRYQRRARRGKVRVL